MNDAPVEERPRSKKTKRKRTADAVAGESGRNPGRKPQVEAGAGNGKWSSNMMLAVALVGAGVIGLPLYLKSNASPDAKAEQSGQATPGRAQKGQPLPRFVDLGTTTCIPCKVMLGVMEELRQKYPGAFLVDFVNVKESPEEAEKYGIQIIPSQIFYAPDGRELFRHSGVFRADEIIAKWAELGYHFTPTAGK